MSNYLVKDSNSVSTRCSLLRSGNNEGHENVSFVSYKSRKSKNATPSLDSKVAGNNLFTSDSASKKEMDMHQLRYEVIKFGTEGLDPLKKKKSSIALAVALGAKPPRNKYTNYKDLVAAKMQERKLALERVQKEKADKSDSSVLQNNFSQPSTRHLYVVGKNVIPAKSKESKKFGMKNFLEGYGKPGKIKKKKRKHNSKPF